MQTKFFEGIVLADIYFRGARTLKDRRRLLRSIVDRLRNRGFSVARSAPDNDVRRASLAAVCVTTTESAAGHLLERADLLLEGPEWEIADLSRAVLELAEEERPSAHTGRRGGE